jgi:hypothetical protein
VIRLRRYSRHPCGDDLRPEDLVILYGLLAGEGLVEVFFHDGAARSLGDFLALASSPAVWLYAAEEEGEFLGLGFVNDFSSSGNTAFAHLAAFAGGRGERFLEAGRLWFRLLREKGGLETILAVLPACYRGARKFAAASGFEERMRLPGALELRRGGKRKRTDAVVCVKDLRAAPQGSAGAFPGTEVEATSRNLLPAGGGSAHVPGATASAPR